jgi:hypothetical protein
METLFGGARRGTRPRPLKRSWRIWALSSAAFTCGIIALLLLAGRRATRVAESQAGAIHKHLVEQQYGPAYDAADLGFRARIAREDFIRYAAATRSGMGSCTDSGIPEAVTFRSSLFGATVRLEYRSRCERGALRESFTVVVDANGAHLMHYEARAL